MMVKLNLYPTARIEQPQAYFEALIRASEEHADWRFLEDSSRQEHLRFEYAGSHFDGEGLQVGVRLLSIEDNIVQFATTTPPGKWGTAKNARHEIADNTAADAQINDAFNLFRPVARRAAQIANLTVRIRPAKTVRYKPPRKVHELIDTFVSCANLAGLHAYDWERFYRIVRHCHSHRVLMRTDDFKRELKDRRVPEHLVTQLTKLYDHGRSLLACNVSWETRCSRRRRISATAALKET